MVLLAAGGAALLVLGLGRWVAARRWGPLLEEAAKSGAARMVGVPVLPVHAVFGALEAVCDLNRRRDAAGVSAAAVSFFSHLGLGAVTAAVAENTGSLLAGTVLAALLHLAWNSWVYRQIDWGH